MDANRVVQVDGLSVRFNTPGRVVQAVNDVSFHVDRGETLAIVGESGSGKSVTSLALMRLVEYGGGGSARPTCACAGAAATCWTWRAPTSAPCNGCAAPMWR